ncbi:sodium/proline symporter PutP [Bacillus taeanensis]|uniref:Sodium/proline symporter n=1 Tax=Bacillus taeanensis TaxID=273032 RepID=A0A366XWQ8_9BACI|nr:sodium/proline symporter PutP [Bacillus taeanensis]RBW70830.1 sodium/proline symporter PutP [Bacillus taeanensis]
MDAATLITFIIYLVGMLLIGVISYRLTSDLSDYVLGGRRLGPGVAALSAGASDMSSWLLLGLPGYAYAAGMDALWICVGLAVGAYLNWQFVAKRLRTYTEVANDSITVPDFFENRFKDNSKILRVISALVTLIFFTFYTSSGLVGGALLFEESFGMTYTTSLWIGAIVIISYTFLGGFLAVSWTDFIQGILMFLALIIVPIVAVSKVGGWNEMTNTVGSMDASYLDAFDAGGAIAVISLLAWGLGYFGQPHIITRFMALRSPKDVPTARLIGMAWMVVGLFGAILTGLAGIAYFANDPLIAGDVDNSEKVFIFFTDVLFNPWVSGILLAAILSAIMSTIDSQLLVSSSALAEDFYKAIFRKNASQKELVWVGRIGVLAIALFALILAQNPESSVLELVSYAWAGFGAAFGPVIILSLFWKRMTRNGALVGMIVGAITVIVWKQITGGIFDLYEILPGFILCTLAIFIVSMVDKEPSKEILAEFEAARK